MRIAAALVLTLLLVGSAAAGDRWHRHRPARAFGPQTEHVIGGRAVTSERYRDHDHRHRHGFRERSRSDRWDGWPDESRRSRSRGR